MPGQGVGVPLDHGDRRTQLVAGHREEEVPVVGAQVLLGDVAEADDPPSVGAGQPVGGDGDPVAVGQLLVGYLTRRRWRERQRLLQHLGGGATGDGGGGGIPELHQPAAVHHRQPFGERGEQPAVPLRRQPVLVAVQVRDAGGEVGQDPLVVGGAQLGTGRVDGVQAADEQSADLDAGNQHRSQPTAGEFGGEIRRQRADRYQPHPLAGHQHRRVRLGGRHRTSPGPGDRTGGGDGTSALGAVFDEGRTDRVGADLEYLEEPAEHR